MPAQVSGPLVLEAKIFENETPWDFVSTKPQIEEIHKVLVRLKGLNKPIPHVQRHLHLPTLSQALRTQAKILQSGRGSFVLRGLDVDRYPFSDNITIYAGLSAYIGNIRGREDNKFIDGGKPFFTGYRAPAYTIDKHVFHTDAGDIVSLFCLDTAKEGSEQIGLAILASSWRVFDELASTRPDIIRTLFEDWVFDGYGNPEKPYTTRPFLYHPPTQNNKPERLIIQYARRGFTGFLHLPWSKDIPPITEAQAKALDALHFLAERYSVTFDLQKGDIQFNDVALFHARDGFVDGPGNERRLIRLWMRDPELAWETPGPLMERWDGLYKDVTEEEQVFPHKPRIRGDAGKV